MRMPRIKTHRPSRVIIQAKVNLAGVYQEESEMIEFNPWVPVIVALTAAVPLALFYLYLVWRDGPDEDAEDKNTPAKPSDHSGES